MEEHRADGDAEREEAPRDDDSDLSDRLGRLEQVVAGMAAEATALRGDSGVPEELGTPGEPVPDAERDERASGEGELAGPETAVRSVAGDVGGHSPTPAESGPSVASPSVAAPEEPGPFVTATVEMEAVPASPAEQGPSVAAAAEGEAVPGSSPELAATQDEGRPGSPAESGPSVAVVAEGALAGPAGPSPSVTATVEIDAVPARPTGPMPSPAYDDTPHPPPKRLRRIGWVVAGTGVCCAVVLGGAVIGGGSAPPWLSIPGVTENDDQDPANTSPSPANSVSGAPEAGQGQSGEPEPGETLRSGEAAEPSAGARSGGSGSPEPLPTETGAVSPSATSGSPSAPEATTPQSPSAGTSSAGAGTGTPTPSGESSEPPPDDHDPLGGLLGGLFGD